QDFAYVNACSEALNNILVMVLDAGFYKSLQQLRDQLPPPSQNLERLQHWWQKNYSAWVEQLRGVIANYRNIPELPPIHIYYNSRKPLSINGCNPLTFLNVPM
ncbi:NACHT C-terminal helical domain 2-containing protein, partial [Microcystis sp.]